MAACGSDYLNKRTPASSSLRSQVHVTHLKLYASILALLISSPILTSLQFPGSQTATHSLILLRTLLF